MSFGKRSAGGPKKPRPAAPRPAAPKPAASLSASESNRACCSAAYGGRKGFCVCCAKAAAAD